MRRHVFIYWVTIILCLTCCMGGCRAKRTVSIAENITSKTEKVEVKKDTSRVEEKTQAHQSIETNEQDNSYVRVTEYDSTGTVIRRVQEEWRDIGRSQLSLLDRSGHYLSLEDMSTVSVSRDSSRTVVSHESGTTTDSRPVQGVEWLWVILAGALILTVVFIIIIRKNRNKWPQ